MSDFVWQTANLAGFISGCYTNDLDMIRASFEDVVIEPQRQALIPGFDEVRAGVDGGGRARLLDLRRGPDDVRVGARGRCAEQCATRWWRRSAQRGDRESTTGSSPITSTGARVVDRA